MKKVLSILTMFVVIASMTALTSCSKEKNIIGKWAFSSVSLDYDGPNASEWNAIVAELEAEENEDMKGQTWEFTETKLTVAQDGYTMTVDYVIDGDELVISLAGEELSRYDIDKLTSRKMVLSMSETDGDETFTETWEFTRA